ncbi:hypothetical protein BT67DRAFT_380726 [Trichocladium antarcticum]|uniref:Zn(2)-C6 fungal-type domain-containing protein n=1 Tax=Trichocladium antarcticum TaxID=1450529 RepID=A0AAN6ZE36_9PEZI|nr:hypothetical protein BT67DRAFT_380726 [Trichocladium antarcticum]
MELVADELGNGNVGELGGLAFSQAVAGSSSSAAPPPPASDTGADAGTEPPVNPRKRKKASRACDFCHVNHQPCDNGKPKCGICTKHNKSCLYLRPTKRRGPQKGYRTALNTYKESAAAWGAVLGAIPGLEALIEGHLRGDAGKAVVASIKNANHQEALITNWQQSSVFKAFFGYNGPPPTGDNPVPSPGVEDEDAGDDTRPVRRPPFKRASQPASQRSQRSQSAATFAMPEGPQMAASLGSPFQVKDSASLSDIVAKDAAQAATRSSQTLASLGFARGETIADFYSMGYNPEPMPEPSEPDFDPSLGSEAEQRAYYELLMGRAFPG